MNREVKLKELQLLDAARRKFLHFQKQQREAELKRLDDEVQRKVSNFNQYMYGRCIHVQQFENSTPDTHGTDIFYLFRLC